MQSRLFNISDQNRGKFVYCFSTNENSPRISQSIKSGMSLSNELEQTGMQTTTTTLGYIILYYIIYRLSVFLCCLLL